jgi:hypothetical protein
MSFRVTVCRLDRGKKSPDLLVAFDEENVSHLVTVRRHISRNALVRGFAHTWTHSRTRPIASAAEPTSLVRQNQGTASLEGGGSNTPVRPLVPYLNELMDDISAA